MRSFRKENKTDIIQSLAESVGLTETFDTRYSSSRYDASTGTYYCAGLKLPHSTMEEVKAWYRHQMEVYRAISGQDDVKMEYFIRYAVAYNAICLLEDNMGMKEKN